MKSAMVFAAKGAFPMLRLVLCSMLALMLISGSVFAADETKGKSATVSKVEGKKVTIKVDGKEQTVNLADVKIMRGKDTAKPEDLKEGTKVQVIEKDGKVSEIRLPGKS
jgi:hypothetical protein